MLATTILTLAHSYNFPEFKKPAFSSSDGRSHRQQFLHKDDIGYVALYYDVQHRDRPFLHLDSNDLVYGVDCQQVFDEGLLIVSMEPEYASSILNASGLIVTGGLAYGCEENGEAKKILHFLRKTAILSKDAKVVSLLMQVEPASLLDVYESATIEFRANKFPARESVNTHIHEEQSTKRKLLTTYPAQNSTVQVRGFFTNFLNDGWRAIQSIGAIVTKIVDTIPVVAKAFAGDISLSQRLLTNTFTWNFDSSGQIRNRSTKIDDHFTCTNCGLKCEANVDFLLSIKGGALESVRLVVGGQVLVSVGIDADFTYTWTNANSATIATLDSGPIPFYVGPIGFVLKITIPIVVGYSASATVSASGTAMASYGGPYAYGFQYKPSTGFGLIHEQNYTLNLGEITAVGSANLFANVYVLPTVQTTIDYIGGPNVGIKGFFEVAVDYSTETDYSDPCAPQPKYSANLGLDITIGAKVDISIGGRSLYKKIWDPVGIYSAKYPVATGCFYVAEPATEAVMQQHRESEARFSQLSLHHSQKPYVAPPILLRNSTGVWFVRDEMLGCTSGNTWFGTVERVGSGPVCDQYPPYRKISWQALDAVNDGIWLTMTMAVTNNDVNFNQKPYACAFQRTYRSQFHYLPGTVVFELAQSNIEYTKCSGEAAGAGCTCTNDDTKLPDVLTGSYTDNFDTIDLADDEGCTTVTLERVLPWTTGTRHSSSKTLPAGCEGGLRKGKESRSDNN